MKKINKSVLGSIAFGCAVLTSMLFPACVQAVHKTHFRAITGRVINDLLIETDDGELWFCETEFKKGTHVICSFDTKGTESIYDDEIFDIKEL